MSREKSVGNAFPSQNVLRVAILDTDIPGEGWDLGERDDKYFRYIISGSLLVDTVSSPSNCWGRDGRGSGTGGCLSDFMIRSTSREEGRDFSGARHRMVRRR